MNVVTGCTGRVSIVRERQHLADLGQLGRHDALTARSGQADDHAQGADPDVRRR